jgi:hypothetical protein
LKRFFGFYRPCVGIDVAQQPSPQSTRFRIQSAQQSSNYLGSLGWETNHGGILEKDLKFASGLQWFLFSPQESFSN